MLVDYAKENEQFKLKGGFIDGRALGAAEIATLATLPSLDELRGKLVGLLQAPAQKLAALLAAPAGQLARVVEARRGKLAESEGGAPRRARTSTGGRASRPYTPPIHTEG